MTPDTHDILASIDADKAEIVNALADICRIPALDPSSGGDGELKKLEFIKEMISDWGFDEFQRYDAPDDRISYGFRPNLVCTYKGTDPEAGRAWMICHTDVVPAGELKDWDTDPFEPKITEDKIYIRGSEDNGQDLIAALFGVKAMMKAGIRAKRDIKIALVAEEETGSKYGIHYLLEQDLFNKDDIIVVPDGGNEDGTLLEVAERSIAWLKVTTHGQQVHASLPHKGNNANEAAMRFALKTVDTLRSKYDKQDPLFDPPFSTFEVTKKDGNVPNVNTIPGEDVIYFDMRIDSEYDPDDVVATMREIADEVEQERGVTIKFEKLQFAKAAPSTPPDAEVVVRLKKAIEEILPIEPKPMGIGGGTCAGLFRREGYEAVVWSIMDEMGHMPNEYALIENLINCTKVYAVFYLDL